MRPCHNARNRDFFFLQPEVPVLVQPLDSQRRAVDRDARAEQPRKNHWERGAGGGNFIGSAANRSPTFSNTRGMTPGTVLTPFVKTART
jgi:hypothetical protein